MTNTWQRWAPVLGILGVVAWIGAFVTGGKTPDPTASDAKIKAYFASHSHQVTQIVAFFMIVVGAGLLLCFLANLRERLAVSDADSGGQSSLMFGSAVASV